VLTLFQLHFALLVAIILLELKKFQVLATEVINLKIKEIALENFHGFSQLNLQFNGNNVVLVGTNGAGKSTILNAAVIILSRIAESLSEGATKKVNLTETDIQNGKDKLTIRCVITYNGFERELAITQTRVHRHKDELTLTVEDTTTDIIEYLHKNLEEKEAFNTPIFVNYPVHRNVLDVPLKLKTRNDYDQYSAYQNCFSSGVNFRVFFEWFRNQEDLENEERLETDLDHQDRHLKAVRTAIYNFMPGFSNLKIMRKGKMRMMITKVDQQLEVNQLSDGEKSILSMVGDLARRLALANPSLENPLEGEGVVLIDEVELHLHPAWEREIVNKLQSTFPNIQFILSTHSPQVLGEIKSAKIFFVTQNHEQKDIQVRSVPTLFGKDSNMILEQFMGAAEKNEEIKSKQRQLFKLLMDSKLVEAKELMDHLVEILGNEDPNLVKADMILRRKESLEK
jgi:predicted ATP-binding protein involved in virulence